MMLKEDKVVQGQGSTTSTKIGKSRVHLQFPQGTHQLETIRNTTVLLDHFLTDTSNSPDPPSTGLSNSLLRRTWSASYGVLLVPSTDVFRVSGSRVFQEILETHWCHQRLLFMDKCP